MSALNRFMSRGFVPPQVHGVLDYPLAAILIAGPLVLDFDSAAATVIALVFGGGASVLAVATAWSTGIVKIIPPLLHGYADTLVTLALIVLPFAVRLFRPHHGTRLLRGCRRSRSARDAGDTLRMASPVRTLNDEPPGCLAGPAGAATPGFARCATSDFQSRYDDSAMLRLRGEGRRSWVSTYVRRHSFGRRAESGCAITAEASTASPHASTTRAPSTSNSAPGRAQQDSPGRHAGRDKRRHAPQRGLLVGEFLSCRVRTAGGRGATRQHLRWSLRGEPRRCAS